MKTRLVTCSLISLMVGALLTGLGLIAPLAHAQPIAYETDDGWRFQVTGNIPVFLVTANHEKFSVGGDDQVGTRVMSGFNPADITFRMDAPTQNGINVSGMFQINHHLQGPGIQNDGLFEGRIADVIISGPFGTINLGKGFGIFNATALGDEGSGRGVGRFLGPDAADATLGRIGTGYTYANFNPRLIYTTPDLSGLTLKAGVFNPENPGPSDADVETSTPRVEGQATYTVGFDGGTLQLWAGGLYQDVNVVSADYAYSFSGWDLGLRLNAAGIGLTGAYSATNSIGADGLIGLNLNGSGLDQADIDATQWYVEGTYATGGFTLGASYGEGDQDAVTTPVGASPTLTNQMLMGFARFMATDHLILMAEIQRFESDAQADYTAFILGTQITF